MITTSPLKALGAALLLLLLPASAVAQSPDGYPDRSAPAHKKAGRGKAGPGKPGPGNAASNEPYGRWDRNWGSRPPAPPKHWTRKGDWHRHVRACRQKFRSYNARTDTYRTSAGKTRRCPV
jgi:hypothetical protein